MPCSSASTLTSISSVPLLSLPGVPASTSQAAKIWSQQVLSQVQAAGGATGVNAVPQQYALVAGSALPPIASTSNCTVTLDTTKQLFGAGSYKIALTGTPAVVTFATGSAWPLQPNWQWLVSFYQQASAAISGEVTVTTSGGKTYSSTFTTGLSSAGWGRLFDALNLVADGSGAFGLSFTFTGGSGDTVWLDGLQLEPFYGRAIQPSPFISTSAPLTLDNNPDGTYAKILASRTSGNVAYNYRGTWSSTAAYLIGDEVVYGQSYWLAVATSTNSAPSTSNANWQVVGSYSGFEGAWSSTTAYVAGAEVTYSGNYWVCVTANTGSAPSTSNANWQIAGPTSAANISYTDGSTVESLKPAQAAADVTADNTAAAIAGQGALATVNNADGVPAGTSYAIPTLNTGGGENLVQNPNFSNGSAGWRAGTIATGQTLPTGATGSVIEGASSSYSLAAATNSFDLVPGATYRYSLWVKSSVSGVTLVPYWGNYSDAGLGTSSATGAWQYLGYTYTVPTGTTGVGAGEFVGQLRVANSSSTAATIQVWGASVVKVRNADTEVSDGTNWLRMPSPAAVSGAATTSLSNGGTSTAIAVGAGTYYLGNIVVNANAGSVDPGVYGGPFFIYFDDPGYAGGTVTYKYSTNLQDIAKGPYRFYVGQITTSSGSGSSGGGGLPPCFSGDTRIRTSEGLQRFDELPRYFELLNRTGRHRAELLVHAGSLAPCRLMGQHLVTDDHLLRVGTGWVKAKFLFSEKARATARTLYNVHVFSDDPEDHHYILENGLTAHNAKP